MSPKKITVLGSGSWGTALAILLARNGIEVQLWGRNAQRMREYQEKRENTTYLPGVEFPKTLHCVADLTQALSDCDEVLVSVPSSAFKGLLADIKPLVGENKNLRLSWATKGLSLQGEFLHDVVASMLPNAKRAVISGPSFAKEVAIGLPTAIVVASEDIDFAQNLQTNLSSSNFRAYMSQDLVGVQLGGVLKNILSVAAGMSDSIGCGHNTRAALITRGLVELQRLGAVLGAKPETLTGLSGLGDIVLTATGDQSRNRRLGLLIGQGKTIEEAKREIGQAIESLDNVQVLLELAKKHQVELPICQQVGLVIAGDKTPKAALESLLERPLKREDNAACL